MAVALHAPRVNNNDDIVQVIAFRVGVGDYIEKGDIVLDVETDKAIVEVAAESDGYVLKLMCEVDDKVAVGSVLLWQGESIDEPVPEAVQVTPDAVVGNARPTAKARALLKELALDASVVPASGERLWKPIWWPTASSGATTLRPSIFRPGKRCPMYPVICRISVRKSGACC